MDEVVVVDNWDKGQRLQELIEPESTLCSKYTTLFFDIPTPHSTGYVITISADL